MLRFASTAVALGLLAGPALAADLPQPQEPIAYDEPVVISQYDWNGAYIGANLGWGFMGFDGDAGTTGALDDNDNGVNVGLYGGYNFMVTPQILLGVEGDIAYNDIDQSAGGFGIESDWNANIRARAGYAVFNNTLLYGTGGVAFADLTATGNGDSDDTTAVGYTVGAGIEQAFTDRISGRVEYLYQDFGSQDFTLGGTRYKTDVDNNIVRAGVAVSF
ncbi:porin family protein [Pseudovibrio exalbescens]|uniref:outer membrane protein n=1 Tax=Pseudovibrio exalbescens TaxID=197461 RepID=UPI002365F6E4|nr:outer membrane protein [Pseudovibrio exalbescens]MDD7910219.1 porin family protein [Pseudovibrio exalbescens]